MIFFFGFVREVKSECGAVNLFFRQCTVLSELPMQEANLHAFNLPPLRFKDQESHPQSRQQHVDSDCDLLKKSDGGLTTGHLSPNLQPASLPTLPQFPPASLVGDKYLMLEQVEGTTLCRCINVHTHEEFVCKVSSSVLISLQRVLILHKPIRVVA